MISYAQNREDVLLNRVFARQASGFYIDIGANHPTNESVTKHFYERGWRGINVEPGGFFKELSSERQRDINLNVAISNQPCELTYYEFPGTGLSTLSTAELAARMSEGLTPVARPVNVLTLRALCESYVPGEIDFISIDVEGHEREVIEGGDWRKWRPRVAVIESTRPNSTEPSHAAWEPILLSAGYQFATFDGLNRFYVREEDPDLAAKLRQPVTVLDDVVSFQHLNEVHGLQMRIAGLEAAVRDLSAAMHDLKRANPLKYWTIRAITKTRLWLQGGVANRTARVSAAESRPVGS